MDANLQKDIIIWGKELGITKISFADINLTAYHQNYLEKLNNGSFGEMHYLSRNVDKRLYPEKLVINTKSIITAFINYFPENTNNPNDILQNANKAYVSRYALGRDYHKVFRKKLQKLADKISENIPNFSYRVFSDSAPILETAIAKKSALGWLGKNNCIINKTNGSWFFLGEIFSNLELQPTNYIYKNNCGTCDACITKCPTNAFISPYQLDYTKCISYLTIEYAGEIPLKLRPLIGNRIYGCDDCQLVCPWNKFKQSSNEIDFQVRNQLDNIDLSVLWFWTEQQFLDNFQGSAIRRIGFEKWQRNLAVAIGNSKNPKIFIPILQKTIAYSSLTKIHIDWAIMQLNKDL